MAQLALGQTEEARKRLKRIDAVITQSEKGKGIAGMTFYDWIEVGLLRREAKKAEK
jgi:hypothetical protein